MKRFLSLSLALVMIICTMSIAPLFASADGETDFLFASSKMNGYNKMETLKTIAKTSTLEVGDDVNVSTRIRFYTSLSSGTDKLFGLAGPQKAAGDKVFCDTVDSLVTNNIRVDRASAANGGISTNTNAYKYMTYEFDFYFPNETSTVGVRNGHINSSAPYYFSAYLLASPSASGYSQMDNKPVARQAYYNNVGINKWHRAKVTFPIDGVTEAPIILYLDGEEVSRSTANLATQTTDGKSLYGLGNAPADLFFNTNKTSGTYIDNVKLYVGDGNIPEDTKPVPAFADSNYKYRSDKVEFPKGSNVSDVKGALATQGIAFCGVYDSTLTTQKDDSEAPATGDILVLGAENGLYTYTPMQEVEAGAEIPYVPYQSADGTFEPGTATNITATAVENGVSFTSPLSSSLSGRVDTNFPSSINLAKLGDEYTLSFKMKHEHLGTKVPNNYVSQFFLKFNTGLYATSYYQLFTNGNGFCIPSSGTGSISKKAVNGETSVACTSANMQVAGMEFDKEYLIQIYVNEKTNTLIYMVNDQVMVDASEKSSALIASRLKGATSWDGFGLMMRGGDGTDPYIKLTMSDFKAIPGRGYAQVNDAEFDLANSELLFNRVNLMPNYIATPMSIIIAGYDGDKLVGTVVKNTLLAKGGVKDSLTLEPEELAQLAGATKVKAFFLDSLNNLTPYGEIAEANIN